MRFTMLVNWEWNTFRTTCCPNETTERFVNYEIAPGWATWWAAECAEGKLQATGWDSRGSHQGYIMPYVAWEAIRMMFVHKRKQLSVWEFCSTFPFLTSHIFCRWEVSARATASPKPRWTFFKLPEEHLRNSKLGRLCQDSQNWEQHSTKYFLQVKKSLLMINPRFYTKHWYLKVNRTHLYKGSATLESWHLQFPSAAGCILSRSLSTTQWSGLHNDDKGKLNSFHKRIFTNFQ